MHAHGDRRARFPHRVERGLATFTALVAGSTSDGQAREDLQRLADEHAALRHLATLVARQSPAARVFAAVAEEAGRLLAVDETALMRYEDDATVTTLASWGEMADAVPVGTRRRLHDGSAGAIVRRTQRPARLDDVGKGGGPWAAFMRALGIRSVVGTPIVVEGQLWGAMLVGSRGEAPLAAGIESRLEGFAELVAAAIANTEARADLAASRARIVEAADDERRRVARDLHDGAQSRLLHAVIAFERAKDGAVLPPEVAPLVEEGLAHARSAMEELRELARGIHPAILTNSGLGAALEELADRAPLPVEILIAPDRYPAAVESTAYFVAAEALTNVEKHARASLARIAVTRTAAGLRLVVEDDGIGGARRGPGGGLAGLGDRLAALGGVLAVESRPGGGARIRAELPLPRAS